jgi:hypothetical protein
VVSGVATCGPSPPLTRTCPGLPDTGLALRLILLDDAFAKIDDRTIGELMELLVRCENWTS